jgi:hypothetical protein
LRARDKSDADIKFEEHIERIVSNKDEIDRHKEFFGSIAQAISILTENINM